MAIAARLRVPAEHPALPGHFPGRPVVPGVLLLDAVLQALRDAGHRPERLLRAKFMAPVTPSAEVSIAVAPRGGIAGRFAFTCQVEDRVVLVGEVACATPP